MATYEFDDLKKTYEGFTDPFAVIRIGGKDIGNVKKGFPVSDLYIDLTSGYEASIAEFSIYDAYDKSTASFSMNEMLKKYTTMGAKVEIALGYGANAKTVFVGAVMRINYHHGLDEIPCIRITAMDVKGVMMASTYSRQLKASCYSAAVLEILERNAYAGMQNSGIINSINVTDTPDKSMSSGLGALDSLTGGLSDDLIGDLTDSVMDQISGVQQTMQEDLTGNLSQEASVTDRTIEMVAESDYEFIVKAAKRYNYEFYTECGNVYFRKAKADTNTRIMITPDMGMYSFDISYDVTGLVNKVTVRATDASKAQVISAVQKNQNTLPGKAKSLIKGSEKVYVDASVTSKEEAGYRAQSLMESISYRFGSLECELQGLPEYLPGYFMELSGLGDGVDNRFYVNRVIHQMTQDGKYIVKLEGKAAGTKENR